MPVDWRAFEQAVAAFLQALDPSAMVSHDRLIPDADTGLPRQRDVWIETNFGGHLRITILVSCKRKKARLSQQDIDAFAGELRSSGAHKGVLYSFGGFSKPALAKAEKLGISCCVLYEGQAPSLPEVLAFDAYCYREQVRLTTRDLPTAVRCTWAELLEVAHPEDGENEPAIRLLAERFNKQLPELQARLGSQPPPLRRAEISGILQELGCRATLVLESNWAIYRAKMESWLVNGSYSITEKDFKGSISTPSVDRFSADPGPGWERIDAAEIPAGRNLFAFYFFGGDVEAVLRAYAAENPAILQLSSAGLAGSADVDPS